MHQEIYNVPRNLQCALFLNIFSLGVNTNTSTHPCTQVFQTISSTTSDLNLVIYFEMDVPHC